LSLKIPTILALIERCGLINNRQVKIIEHEMRKLISFLFDIITFLLETMELINNYFITFLFELGNDTITNIFAEKVGLAGLQLGFENSLISCRLSQDFYKICSIHRTILNPPFHSSITQKFSKLINSETKAPDTVFKAVPH
jgi:hypothetical protein